MKAETQTDICTLMFISELLVIVKRWKQTKSQLADEWMNKIFHTENEILFRHKRETNSALAGWLSGLELCLIHQKIEGSIPGQYTYLGCRFNPGRCTYGR